MHKLPEAGVTKTRAPVPPESASPTPAVHHTVLDLLDLEEVEQDLYRASLVYEDDEHYPLYGGQVAAQALLAAGRTVPQERAPHSLHGYFLRGGSSARPTVFRVERDRDGRSYSARRVVAIQDGAVIFTMSASFSVPEAGIDVEPDPIPELPPPAGLPDVPMERLLSFEGRLPAQVRSGPDDLPTRIWARCTAPLPDSPLLHACVLTYLSDFSTGLAQLEDGTSGTGSSLDHAVWFHRDIRMDDWVFMELVPHTAAGARGWYTGAVHRADGVRVASLTQEALFRKRR
ncbi:acyl-CoA thioesterase [Streptomyces sp. NPDC056660]|uniref:acyl-CoA thioesterase n=1 Tax=Streptomyces sp. NPDC056660 TaxID=3345897 RepID=UPI00367B7933